jgi:hypothetical protein
MGECPADLKQGTETDKFRELPDMSSTQSATPVAEHLDVATNQHSDAIEKAIGTRTIWLTQVWEAARTLAGLRANEQPNETTRSGIVSPSQLGSVPPTTTHSRHSRPATIAVLGTLVGLVSVVAATDGTAIGQFPLLSIWRQVALDRMEPKSTPARLVAQGARALPGNPAPLGLRLQGQAEGAVVVITGLMPEMELSMGAASGPATWRLAATDLENVWIGPPNGFTGSIDFIAELRLADDTVLDRQAVHLEWSPQIATALAQKQHDRGQKRAEPAFALASAQNPLNREQISSSPALSTTQLDQEAFAVLLKRAKQLFASGDLAAARLVLQRAAEANNAEAALALGATYDPFVFRQLKVYGFAPDAAMARSWYEKAAELGSSAAPRRLDMLTEGMGAR